MKASPTQSIGSRTRPFHDVVGLPGTGKTTLAELIAHYSNAHVERISAVTSGVKDIRAAIEQAKAVAESRGQRTLLFVDEVHRFNKASRMPFCHLLKMAL